MSNRIFTTLFIAITLPTSLLAVAVAAENWPAFRGGDADGKAAGADLPITWSETENVTWRTRIPGRAWSSPVIWGDQVWMCNATEDGLDMSAVCVSLKSGEILHDLPIFQNEEIVQEMIPLNSFASPTPCVEEGRVYVHFGTYGTACLDAVSGKTIWKRTDINCDHFRGPGSSPILAGDLLVLSMDGIDEQYMIALDKQTGKTVWRTNRSIEFGEAVGDLRKAYSTPTLIEHAGRRQIISCGAFAAYSYDPATGRELWRVTYPVKGYSNVVQPLYDGRYVYLNTGFGRPVLMAVRPDGSGDVTDTHVAWTQNKGMPQKPTPIILDGRMYSIDDRGVATCLDLEQGDIVEQTRVGSTHSASVIGASGRFYCFSHEGRCTTLSADPELKILGKSELESDIMATPAVAGDALILRTKDYLYRIE